jgi:hypothetical protein
MNAVIPKIFEKVIFDQMYEYLTTRNLLSNLQSGFRPLHSTLTALLDATDQWYTNMDNGLINGILFIDLDLFRNYLSERTQVTVINNISSQKCRLQCGVIQGSILGPSLFLIYNKLLTIYQIVISCLTVAILLLQPSFLCYEQRLKYPKKLARSNKLRLNALKTKCMFISTRHTLTTIPDQPEISANVHNIKRVKTCKSLGIELDELLSWDEHIIMIIEKVTKVIGALRRLKSYLPLSVLVIIYKS